MSLLSTGSASKVLRRLSRRQMGHSCVVSTEGEQAEDAEMDPVTGQMPDPEDVILYDGECHVEVIPLEVVATLTEEGIDADNRIRIPPCQFTRTDFQEWIVTATFRGRTRSGRVVQFTPGDHADYLTVKWRGESVAAGGSA